MKIQDLQRLCTRFYRVLHHTGGQRIEYFSVWHSEPSVDGVWIHLRRVIPKQGKAPAREKNFRFDVRQGECRIIQIDSFRISITRGKKYGGGRFTVLFR